MDVHSGEIINVVVKALIWNLIHVYVLMWHSILVKVFVLKFIKVNLCVCLFVVVLRPSNI